MYMYTYMNFLMHVHRCIVFVHSCCVHSVCANMLRVCLACVCLADLALTINFKSADFTCTCNNIHIQ